MVISSSKTPKEVTPPASGRVLVECPLVGKRLRDVNACQGCEHHKGLYERFDDDRIPFAKRYMVACSYPTTRALFEVAEEPDGRTE